MTPEQFTDGMTPEQLADRLDDLKAKLRARQGNPVFNVNCLAIQAEIERLEAVLAKTGS